MANNDITATMGFDGGDFDKAFDAALKRTEKGVDSIQKKTKDGFFSLKSDMRVENQLGALAKGLVSVDSAAGAATMTLDRLENVFQSSIGASVAVAAVGALIGKFVQLRDEQAKFAAEAISSDAAIGKAIGGGEYVAALDAIMKRLAEIEAARQKSTGVGASIVRALTPSPWRDNPEEKFRAEELQKQKEADAAIAGIVDKSREDKREADWKLIQDTVEKEDAAAEKISADRKKWVEDFANWRAQHDAKEFQDYWKMVTDVATKRRAEIEEAAREHEKIMAEDALNIAKQKFKALDDLATAGRNLADAKEKQADEQRQANLANEMLPPEQRKLGRDTERAQNRAEDNAIRRIAQKEQDAANRGMLGERMSNEKREARVAELRGKHAEDKKGAAQKAVELADKNFKDKAAAAQKAGMPDVVKDINAVNLIVDVFKNSI